MLEKLKPIAKRIFGVEPASARKRNILRGIEAVGNEGVAEFVEVHDSKRRMSFFRWRKIWLDADMQLLVAAFEPATTPRPESNRLLNFTQA